MSRYSHSSVVSFAKKSIVICAKNNAVGVEIWFVLIVQFMLKTIQKWLAIIILFVVRIALYHAQFVRLHILKLMSFQNAKNANQRFVMTAKLNAKIVKEKSAARIV